METVLREECRRLGISLTDEQLAQFRVFGMSGAARDSPVCRSSLPSRLST